MTGQASPTDTDEDGTVRLLRLAGVRPPVPDARADRVRGAVSSHWQAARRRRTVRRRAFAGIAVLAAAAAGALIAGRGLVVERSPVPPDRVVAVVERVVGAARRTASTPSGETGTLSARDAVRSGEWIQTDPDARAALRFSDGTSVRLDVGTRVHALDADAIELSSGAVYVDTGRSSGRFEVRTDVATARDIGTQFEVRLVDRGLRLRVRTGIVELTHGERSVSGRAGTEVILSAAEAVTRPLAPYGPEWEWTAGLAPPPDFEGQTLSAFLARVAHEHGWEVRYADATLERTAARIVLHGSVSGLTPREAVDVAVATSGLLHRFENGTLVVLSGSVTKKEM